VTYVWDAEVHSPADDVAAPCDEVQSARSSRGVIGVVCDASAFALLDGNWTELTTRAVALDAVSGTVVVAHRTDECNGLAVTRFTGAETDELMCMTDAVDTPTAMWLLDGRLLLWSGDDVVAATL